MERVTSPDGSNSGSSPSSANSEYSTWFHMYTSTVSFPVPTARSKRKADDSVDNDHQEKRQKKIVDKVTREQRRPGDVSANPIVRTPPPVWIRKAAPPPKVCHVYAMTTANDPNLA